MKYVSTLLLVLHSVVLWGNTSNFGDCVGATTLCSTSSYTFSRISGRGAVDELNPNNTCFNSQESNSHWFKFVIDRPGYLIFTIVPKTGIDDFDFILYRAGADSCSGLDSPSGIIRCNFAGSPGLVTGLSATATATSADVSGDLMLSQVPTQRGEVYYLLVDNYTTTGNGFDIDFSGSTTGFLTDSSTVDIVSVSYDAAHHDIQVNLSAPIAISSITDQLLNELTISGSGNVEIDFLIFHGIATVDGLQVSSSFSIILEQQLTTDVSYLLELDTGGDGNVLLTPCGTETEYDSISFYVAATDTALVGIETAQPVFAQQVQVFPNPTKDVLYISTDLPEGTAWSATVFDLSGKQISKAEVATQNYQMDLNALPNGTYLLVCNSAFGSYQQKVVLLH